MELDQLLKEIEYYDRLNKSDINELDRSMYEGLERLKHSKNNIKESFVEMERVDEAAISATLIVSILLGLPSLIKNIASALGFLYKKIKKLFGGKEESKAASKIVELAEKWHHSYIVVLRQILRAGGVFKSAGISDKEKQERATEVVFYTIIFGFAIHGGVTTAKSIIHIVEHEGFPHLKLATLEGILTGIKSREVQNFIKKLV